MNLDDGMARARQAAVDDREHKLMLAQLQHDLTERTQELFLDFVQRCQRLAILPNVELQNVEPDTVRKAGWFKSRDEVTPGERTTVQRGWVVAVLLTMDTYAGDLHTVLIVTEDANACTYQSGVDQPRGRLDIKHCDRWSVTGHGHWQNLLRDGIPRLCVNGDHSELSAILGEFLVKHSTGV